MARTKQPAGLIRFASQRAMEQPAKPAPPLWRRPRPMAYALLIAFVAIGTATLFQGRGGVSMMVEPVRSRGYVLLSDGSVRNDFTLLVRDGRAEPAALVVRTSGLPGATVRVGIGGDAPAEDGTIPVASGDTATEARLLITVPPGVAAADRTVFSLRLEPVGGGAPVAETESFFVAPPAGAR